MAPAPIAIPPSSHRVPFLITARLFAKRIEPGGDRRQSAESSLSIQGREAGPLGGHTALGEDRLDRTLGHTRVAIDTRLWVDDKHVVIEMKGLNGTNKRAVSVTTVNARFSHDVGHLKVKLLGV